MHNGYSFTTKDQDNDVRNSSNCAVECNGAWWYWDCFDSNLNGLYRNGTYAASGFYDGVVWATWKGYDYSVKITEMKIRPLTF